MSNEIMSALKLINEYISAQDRLPNPCSDEEWKECKAAQRKRVRQLIQIDHPIVQAIALRLQIDRTYWNCKKLICKLSDEADKLA